MLELDRTRELSIMSRTSERRKVQGTGRNQGVIHVNTVQEEGAGNRTELGSHLFQMEPVEEEGPGNWMEPGSHQCRPEPVIEEGPVR